MSHKLGLVVVTAGVVQRASRLGSARRKLRFEQLESRQMLTTFMVTNLNDAVVTSPGGAPGTLRQAIFDANASPNPDIIEFAPGLGGSVNLSVVGVIDPTAGASAFAITSPVTIRGNANGITIATAATTTDRRLFRVAPNGDLTLESIMLTGGTSRGPNGGAGQDGGSAFGGAVYNQGTLHVLGSTIYGNRAIGGNTSGGGTVGAGFGGAIYNDGGTVSVVNSTLSGNSASVGTGGTATVSFGGSLYSKNGTVQIYNSTITLNNASAGRELYVFGVGSGQTATLNVYSSIIARADKPTITYDVVATDDQGGNLIVAGANNLIRAQNGFQSITVTADPPLLGELANNGGRTLTHAPLSGSPAIDQGSNPQALSNDQRGSSYARTVGAGTDIGAFEVQTVAALPGDYSGNLVVDAADFVLWRKTMGTSVAAYSGADGDGSSTIDGGDYDVWRTHFGLTSGAGAMSFGTSSIELSKQDEGSDLQSAELLVARMISAPFPSSKDDLILAPGASLEVAHDLALLDLTTQDSNSGLRSRRGPFAGRIKSKSEPLGNADPHESLSQRLIQVRLRMPTLAAASTCIA